jgi:hypothetical protein
VQALSGSSRVRPSHEAGYVVWVWSTHGTSKGVTVQAGVTPTAHVGAVHFTVCPTSGTAQCTIGTLPAGQADELQATAWVRHSAVSGEQVELNAIVSGTNAHSYHASGTVVVVAAKTPPPTTVTPPPTGSVTLPPVSLPSDPAINGGLGGIGGGSGNPAGLFPTVSPSASPSPGSLGFPPARKAARARAADAAAIVPLDPRLIGGQLAGLAVLAGAIAIAIARLSLRKPRTQDGPGNKGTSK